jgi:hypothetical protein
MKIATVCTGVGAPEQAIKELGWNHESVSACRDFLTAITLPKYQTRRPTSRQETASR